MSHNHCLYVRGNSKAFFFANTMTAFCMLRLLQQETLLSGVCTRSCSGCFLVRAGLRRIT
ncbi:hypothetical protein APHDU1_0626 [Anaplasma phagocytophilum]|nr:hypothetical protein OTSANNIE_0102 [Anaplasma phagocytophilum str. Annie]KJV99553.1 hypothetical protein OTSANNIE_0034 [Anaplasma phagocytophilum str. Annie]KKA00005.1 hypothetical protein APHDU1_0690 [Anaplasma phagocytophilum]KKA00251.1 hypothetical protein APHDU1_0626 [Anaplasma phagocytophilum]